MKYIKIGDLKNKIDIQEYVSTENENLFEEKEWITLLSPFAKIENTNGSRYFNSSKEDIKKISNFTIRYNSILKGKDESKLRIVYNDKNYLIQYINDIDEAHNYFEIVGESNGK
jgi:SPP1 family predicted phage head-tail adaptor